MEIVLPSALIRDSSPKSSFFITLVEMTDAARRSLEEIPKMHTMIHSGLTLQEYRAFLHDLYHIVWHFCPVMAAGAARCDDRFREVRYELYERIEEEKGHEAWVLEDIEAVGGDVAGACANPPSVPIQAMIAYNYHAAERVHPCSVLGMLYMLEVVSSVYAGRTSESIASALRREVDAGGFKFLSSHSTLDADHLAKLNVLIKKVDDPAAQESIVNSTRVNFFQFGQMFREDGFTSLLG
jgi:pyrroloquinoline quinone (PQQ) biosynthesis protein C